jgi:hypothetical protein
MRLKDAIEKASNSSNYKSIKRQCIGAGFDCLQLSATRRGTFF